MNMFVNGPAIRAVREGKGFTQIELATMAGVTPSMLCMVENGKAGASLPLLMRITKALGANIDIFIRDRR